MPLTRRAFARHAAALLPLGILSTRNSVGRETTADSDVGVMPRGVEQVPQTPFRGSPDGWSLVMIPDSQHDVAFYPEVFQRQMDWIVQNRESNRIRFVLHEGDVTDDNGERQWGRVREGFDKLRAANVPFALTTGNHDFDLVNGKLVNRSTRLNDYFTAEDYALSKRHGLHQPGHLENSWHVLSTPAGPLLLLSLEFGAPLEVLQWARSVIAEVKPYRTILVTHAYLSKDGSRYDFDAKGTSQSASPRSYAIPGITDGEIIWREFVQHEDTIRLVVCGHTIGNGAAHLVSRNLAGNDCHQLMANYQMQVRPARGHGSGGFLLLLQFEPDGRSFTVRTYSPWYNLWLDGPAQQRVISWA